MRVGKGNKKTDWIFIIVSALMMALSVIINQEILFILSAIIFFIYVFYNAYKLIQTELKKTEEKEIEQPEIN